MYIIIALIAVFGAIILDWQKDKTSFLAAAQTNWLKYAAMFVFAGFLTGYLLDYKFFRYVLVILTAGGLYFLWSLVVNTVKNIFKKKTT